MKTSNDVFAEIERLDIPMPPLPKPNGLYEMVTIDGGVAYTSGQLSRLDNEGNLIAGPIMSGDEIETARLAAKVCFVRGLMALDMALGNLNKIKNFIFLRGFINAAPGFSLHSQVMDSVSQLALDLFGPAIGSHSRSALGAGSLPSSGLVEIEFVVRVDG